MKNRYILGLTIGAIWLTTASAGFGTWSLLAIGTPEAKAGLFVLLAMATSLITIGASVVAQLRRSPDGFGQNSAERREMGRRFAWTVAAELLGFGAVTAWCIYERHFEWIVSLNIIVVGVHFFPLARIFGVPRYHVMALLFCAIPLVTLLTIPGGTRLGGALAIMAIPSLGCSVVSLFTAAANFREAWRFVALAARRTAS